MADTLPASTTLFRFGGKATIPVADSAGPTVVPKSAWTAKLLVLTGTLTESRSVTLPLQAGWDWYVLNQTNYAITVGGQTGAGVSVPAGDSVAVVCTGQAYALVGAITAPFVVSTPITATVGGTVDVSDAVVISVDGSDGDITTTGAVENQTIFVHTGADNLYFDGVYLYAGSHYTLTRVGSSWVGGDEAP